MREILTIIAACLVAVLTAALAVPPFVDWDAQRARIETRLGVELGGKVQIEGPVSLRLLPAPRMSFGALAVERPGLRLRSDAATFELSPTALLRGRFDFTEAALDKAALVLTPAGFSVDAAQGARVGVARLRLTDASLILDGPGMPGLEHVDMTGTADSLLGPFRGTGTVYGARVAAFTFSTGPAVDGKMLGKIVIDDSNDHDHAEIDGTLALAAGALAFAGNGVVSGSGDGDAPPWRAGFSLKASPDGAQAENIEARLGDEEHALAASGDARVSRDGALDAKLAGRNLDLDRFRQAWSHWRSLDLLAPAGFSRAAHISISADSATLGGVTIAALALQLTLAPGETARATLDADLPGRAHIRYAGKIAPDGAFEGEARAATRDPEALGAWIAPFAPNISNLLKAALFARIDIAGSIASREGGIEVRVADAQLDRSRFSGTIGWTPARQAARAKLQADISSPALDIDGLPDLDGLTSLGGDVDLSARFDARAIRIARVGAAAVDAGHIRFRATRDVGGVSLDDIGIDNLGGASLAGSARLASRDNQADLKLDAQSLSDLAMLLRRVAPGAATEAFASRAQALSPAHLSLALRASDARLNGLSLAGEAGGTKVSAQLKADATFSGHAVAGDAAALLRQAGLPVLPLKGFGLASLDVAGQGEPDGGIRGTARFSGAGARANFAGEVALSLHDASASGDVSFETADATPLVQILGFGAGDLTQRIPVQARAQARLAPVEFSLDDLEGSFAGVRVAGKLARRADGSLDGALSLDRLSALFLASLALGPAQPATAGALWPRIKFAPGEFDPPRATLDLAVARVDLGGGAAGADAHAKLTTTAGAVALTDLRMQVAGGTMAGDVSLRREGQAAMAKAAIRADGVALAGGPFSSRVSGRLALSGEGASAAELVGSLAGEGRARFSEAAIFRAAPGALADVVAQVERDDGAVVQATIVKNLAERLDSGAQRLEPFDVELSLSNGRLALASVSSRAGLTSARLSGAFDLRSGALDVREKLIAPPPADWSGQAPSVDIAWSGAAQAPVRSLQANSLVAALADRAIARETARNAALEADIRERAFFNRRLKSDRRLESDRRGEADAQRKAQEAARLEREESQRLEAMRLEREKVEREKLERERASRDKAEAARADRERRVAPAPVAPDARRGPSAFAPSPSGAAPDPSTAGRY